LKSTQTFRLETYQRTLLCACILLINTVLYPLSLHAHKDAASSFEARTEGDRRIAFAFRIDATSVAELVAQKTGLEEKPTKLQATAKPGILIDEIFKGFRVRNNGESCPPSPPTRIEFAKAIDKVIFNFAVTCPADLNHVELQSALFMEEETTHRVLGTFLHRRAREHYTFAGGTSALIRTKELRQLPQRAGTSGPMRFATPPDGAFANASQPTSARAPTTSSAGGFLAFVQEGLFHIWGGPDHILFVIALLLAVVTWRSLLILITCFTVAHSCTLVLGALGLIYLSPALVEPVIALSITWVAVENLVRKETRTSPWVVIGFGLIHGLGFSGALIDLGLTGTDQLAPLLGFNLGVEFGQLAIVLPLFALLSRLRQNETRIRRIRRSTSVILAIIGLIWFVERVVSAFA
jgi:hydrogenase/urease accessory protein HupE